MTDTLETGTYLTAEGVPDGCELHSSGQYLGEVYDKPVDEAKADWFAKQMRRKGWDRDTTYGWCIAPARAIVSHDNSAELAQYRENYANAKVVKDGDEYLIDGVRTRCVVHGLGVAPVIAFEVIDLEEEAAKHA